MGIPFVNNHSSHCIIAQSYEEYYQLILSYITKRINHKYDAEDLTQDVFMRLIDYSQMLRESTVKYFLFTIARNIVTDYIRRYYKKQEVTSYIYDTTAAYTTETEEKCIVKDLLKLENKKLNTFSPQRKTVYMLSRFREKTVTEISSELHLSKSTVENHLFLGRKIMREYIRQCI